MTVRAYASPQAFKQALEQHLKDRTTESISRAGGNSWSSSDSWRES
jgi:hypothetical protein